MNARVQHHVAGRLSLRPPQAESVAKLIAALNAAPELLAHGVDGQPRDVSAILNSLKGQFTTLEDFEREFPSLCFAMATGVGKTRLMGAFIAYLHLAHGINNFFVLAPNLTIYNKLIADFTPNTPKYVFKGIAEFAQQPPLIITGDNYDQSGAAVADAPSGFAHDVRINIFNISKINSEVRGGKEPRIKRMKEVLGDSYFNHLANLPDLVMLMDESHRYRASAGVRSINDLRPLMGLEVTATPFVESTKGPVPFKNVVMQYSLAQAMEDGFVKEPAVATQRNFDAKAHSAEEIEKIKLEDGVRLHENTKVELQTYALDNGVKRVKPFMLVIARDTTHAAQLKDLIESPAFFEGRYTGKVIQVDSSRTGAEEEEMIARLLAVESVDEPTEIVIHVNMLKEGWDVTNLYTIVPLRAANARTLVEQSIGRGLRLPYGKRTGVEVVDRLTIVAHDKFQEIVDEANKGDSPLKLKTIILEPTDKEERKVSVQVQSGVMVALGLASAAPVTPGQPAASTTGSSQSPIQDPVQPVAKPLFTTDAERNAAVIALEVIAQYEVKRETVPTSGALLTPAVQAQIVAEVQARLLPKTGDLLGDADPQAHLLDVAAVVAKTTEVLVQQTIDIPRIAVVPSGDVTTGFHPFKLDVSGLYLQPSEREIVIQSLQTNEQSHLASQVRLNESRLEDYIVRELVEFDDIDYFTQAELLYDLAGQMVAHLKTYLTEEADIVNVLDGHRQTIGKAIHAQMMAHFWEKASSYEVKVSRGFTELRPCNYTAVSGQPVQLIRETLTEVSKIRQMLFGGFAKCLYPLQKFDSDTERRFAVILERDASKWFKPAKGQFQIFYKLGTEQPEYIPDFVVETDGFILMAETKAKDELKSGEVLAKADAAVQWCKHASDYAASVGGKPWKYLLVPHDGVSESKRLVDYWQYQQA
ncbi:type III restriction endonuclease subunit R [Limnohabitans sp. 2KL-17]|uniref:DEAD/DEAH box helicase family protein n=1 Tax=Limnohabitans sp. 2KL-17 TaxID=1100704 RepID=UPI000D354574|nr:DEAD/DEAH box helicase family protein [Limnohabitans sp. 2KL-17]PUE62781.1 type III restriction endonuclease subunit R [Limnohabitans sp. 2KL-17]